MRIMHGLAMKFRAMIRRALAARREAAVIPLPVVQVVIHMPVKMIAPMKPGPRTDEDAAVVPLRSVIPIGRALVWRSLIVAIGAIRLHTNFDPYLCRCLRRCRKQQPSRNRHSRNQLQNLHTFPLVLEGDATANGCFNFFDKEAYVEPDRLECIGRTTIRDWHPSPG